MWSLDQSRVAEETPGRTHETTPVPEGAHSASWEARWAQPVPFSTALAVAKECPKSRRRTETSLAARFPALAAQWHPTLNGALTPPDVRPYLNQMVWWLCPNGHSTQDTLTAVLGEESVMNALGRGPVKPAVLKDAQILNPVRPNPTVGPAVPPWDAMEPESGSRSTNSPSKRIVPCNSASPRSQENKAIRDAQGCQLGD